MPDNRFFSVKKVNNVVEHALNKGDIIIAVIHSQTVLISLRMLSREKVPVKKHFRVVNYHKY